MFTESAERVMCCSHRVPGPGAAVGPLHGHNWRVRAVVEARELSPLGRVVDGLGEALWAVLEPWDHRHLNDVEPFSAGLPPTAGCVAQQVGERLARRVDDGRVRLARVEVHPEAGRSVCWHPVG